MFIIVSPLAALANNRRFWQRIARGAFTIPEAGAHAGAHH
jgi:hypothetical protein